MSAATTDRGAWANPTLAYAYVLAQAVAEGLPEDSPAEEAVRSAMSKLDEADMHLRGVSV